MALSNVNESLSIQPIDLAADYSYIMEKFGLSYVEDGIYLRFGNPNIGQGWALYISVIWSQLEQLLNEVIPFLVKFNVSFKIVSDRKFASLLMGAHFGHTQLGRTIVIFPESDNDANTIAHDLVLMTHSFRGPDIPYDAYLGGRVFTRYGAFNPLAYRDRSGHLVNYIKGLDGKLLRDDYSIPYKMVSGIKWPFNFLKLRRVTISNFIGKYRIINVIKADAKGRVIKSLMINGFKIQWCIVKEGRHDMCMDLSGRDVRDRLKWQYALHRELSSELPIPEAYDFFVENDNVYFVMEFIKGTPLKDRIDELYEGNDWYNLSNADRLKILDYLLKILDMIKLLHARGYVHRDITHMNFLLDKFDNPVLIDLELAYRINTSDSPFTLGTDGFMSPEQFAVSVPTVKEDIYGVGALMVVLFTKLNPSKLDTGTSSELEKKLLFFISDVKLVNIIARCLSRNPEDRPGLDDILGVMTEFQHDLRVHANSIGPNGPSIKLSRDLIHEVIKCAVSSFNTPLMRETNRVWHSNLMELTGEVANRQVGRAYYFGIHTGVSGVLWFLSVCKQCGFYESWMQDGYYRAYDYLKNYFLRSLPQVNSGLYVGAAGVAVGLAKGIDSGFFEDSAENRRFILECLSVSTKECDLADGVAGQGIALLHSFQYIESAQAEKLFEEYISIILNNQLRDGSWLTLNIDGSKRSKYSGFSHGVSGILYFLLEYCMKYKSNELKHSIQRGINWVLTNVENESGDIFWYVSEGRKERNIWFGEGTCGIVLCLIRAYEALGDSKCKEIAERAMMMRPQLLSYRDFSFVDGLVGWGEVYLEAFRVFKDKEWLGRAEWIVSLLLNTIRVKSDGTIFWIVEDNKQPTADFMVGSSGLIHFLLRYLAPSKLGMPIF